MLELCERPEYIELVREELSARATLDYPTLTKLPILDSFIKEAVRLNPLDRSTLT